MTITLKAGMKFKTPDCGDNTFTIETVTDKKVSWSRNDGLTQKANVNRIRVFCTSLAKAQRMADSYWIFINN